MELSDATEKAPPTPGIDPGTFRIVAQCLNHYATSGPNNNNNKRFIIIIIIIIISVAIILGTRR
jgi:hypothetical protein